MRIGDRAAPRRARGVSLIELIVVIVIMSVCLVGILSVLNVTVARSADPMIRKQVLSIAEALLEEVELMPFTYCDPDDANAATAQSAVISATGCASTIEAIGPEAGESRYSTTTPFDNVNDYHGFRMDGIRDLTNTAVAGLENYSAAVTVTQGGLGLANADVLLIAVTATGPGSNESVTLSAYRTRYAPNSLP